MADDTTILDGAGVSKTFATDDISSVFYPRVKVTWGPDGTANDADVATGKPMPVQIRTATGLIPYGEPTDAKSASTDTTSVAIIPLLKQISANTQTSYAGTYETVAHDVGPTTLGSGSGATGDYISHVICIPETTSPGAVTVTDNATAIIVFVGGASSVSNLVPFTVFLGMTSASGAWKLTCGSNIHAIGIGKFT